MFCPQCGQQQPSDEIRFCPKCGLSLAPHVAILAGGDATTAVSVGGAQAPAQSRRSLNTRRAGKLMFFAAVIFPVFMILAGVSDHPGPLVVPVTLFFIGLMWLLYARLFGEGAPLAAHHTPPKDLRAGFSAPALGAPPFVPASSFNQRADTAEIVPPPSVTENTTTLLDKGR